MVLTPPDDNGPVLAGADAITGGHSRWPAVIGIVLTLAMVAGLAREIAGSGLTALRTSVPANPLFYVIFVPVYLALPVGDYVIFRRLWRIPLSGLVALIKKRIANEVVLGYSGEAYFLAWAVARAHKVTAPFGAVKDVSILSAMAGNSVTLAMVMLALPFARTVMRPMDFNILLWSSAGIVAITLPFLVLSRRIFTLPRRDLWWIFMVHGVRLVLGALLLALAWHIAMPDVAIGVWLLLSAGRMLVSRLPLLPNKDLVFANFTILLLGHNTALSTLVAVTAALTLLVHAALVVVFSLYSVVRKNV